jgi:hypothetical protein
MTKSYYLNKSHSSFTSFTNSHYAGLQPRSGAGRGQSVSTNTMPRTGRQGFDPRDSVCVQTSSKAHPALSSITCMAVAGQLRFTLSVLSAVTRRVMSVSSCKSRETKEPQRTSLLCHVTPLLSVLTPTVTPQRPRGGRGPDHVSTWPLKRPEQLTANKSNWLLYNADWQETQGNRSRHNVAWYRRCDQFCKHHAYLCNKR